MVASKYFYGDVASGNGSPAEGKREYSVRQLVDRVTRTIADWGKDDGYFATAEDAERFYDELTALCLNQYGSFNSPVWFNVGLFHRYGIAGPANNWRWDEETRTVVRATSAYQYPQASACFIQSVSDDMEGIMRLATSEAMLFKFGSGTGTDLSTLRSSQEKLSGGGKPSGPVSFMRVYDAIASVVKSGGKTRRAAKMQTLKCWHPDILEFIECKTKEEKKAQALIRAGYEANFNGEAYSSVMFQNANLSVRCTDAFLRAGRDRRGVDHPRRHDRPAHADLQGPDAAGQDRRGDLALRRPRRPVRGHHPALAHLPQHRADQFVQSVQRVHVHRRFGVQSVVDQPDEVPPRGRQLRRRAVPGGGADLHHGAGDPGRPRELPDRPDRGRTATSSGRWGWAMPTSAAC